jgi:nucleoside-diphosphate-sugar epimerase
MPASGLGRVLVAGGAGCMGSHMIEVLHDRREEFGVEEIAVLDMLPNVKLAFPDENARIKGYVTDWFVGSVTDLDFVRKAVRGCNTVIHVASVIDTGTVNKRLLHEVNVKGTENIIACCLEESSVNVLVYSSSLDVIISHYDYRPRDGETEDTCRYTVDDDPAHVGDPMKDTYGFTKGLAERRTLRANLQRSNFRTCAIRPVGIYGERDAVHVNILLTLALDAGSFHLFRFGDGSAVFQHVYARNCAVMHVMAAKRLMEGNDQVAGQAFFGIDDTKVNNFFDFFAPYWAAKGYRIPTIHVPLWLLYPVAAFAEDCFRLCQALFPQRLGNYSFKLTRRAVHGPGVTQWFNTDKARRLIGYIPEVSPMEARRRTIEFFDRRKDEFPPGRFKYAVNEHNYLDYGTDFRPDSKKYLERKKRNVQKVDWYWFTCLAIGSAAVVSSSVFLKLKQ